MSRSQRAILAALNSKPREPVKLGWFVPNSPGLNTAVRNAIRDGRRVVVDPVVTGPLWFVAEDKA